MIIHTLVVYFKGQPISKWQSNYNGESKVKNKGVIRHKKVIKDLPALLEMEISVLN